ncbi:MAG: NAD-dependent epimerase/dehydratase family protein [Promethearchaeota archaeon]
MDRLTLLKQTVLLTGASGSVGIKTFEALYEKNDKYKIRLLLRDSKKNRRLFKQYEEHIDIIWGDLGNLASLQEAVKNLDIVIHIAGVIPISKYNTPSNVYAVNVKGTQNLLTSINKSVGNPKILYTSSIAVYGDRIRNPWITVKDPTKPSPGDNYGESKLEAEKIIQNSGLNFCIFRLSYCASTSTLKFHPTMFRMPLETKLELVGTGDVGQAIVNALERDDVWGRIYNIGGGADCRVEYSDFLAKIFKIMGLGSDFFPGEAFSTTGYHCGYITPSEIEKKLNFQNYTLQDFYAEAKKWIGFKRYLTPLLRWFLRKYLIRRSIYYKEYKKNKNG